MSTLAFYAQFTKTLVGVNSLSVVWDVERITRSSGARSALVTGGATSITIGRRGLYGYLLTDADTKLYDYVATAITAGDVDQKEIAALWSMYEADALKIGGQTTSAAAPVAFPAAVGTSTYAGADTAGTTELLTRIPDATPGAAGGLPTVDANNYIAGIVGTKNQLDDLVDAAAAPAASAIASQVRTELSIELGRLDVGVGTRGTGTAMTSQQVRDAMKLAPTTGTPTAGSVDAELDALQTNTAALAIRNAMKLAPTSGAPSAGSVDKHLDDIIAITSQIDVTAVTQVSQAISGHLAITAGLTFNATVTGLTIPADWDEAIWTLKRSTSDTDADAVLQLRSTNGIPATPGDDALTVTQASGSIAIYLTDETTAALTVASGLGWDVKFIDVDGDSTGHRGTAEIMTTETQALA